MLPLDDTWFICFEGLANPVFSIIISLCSGEFFHLQNSLNKGNSLLRSRFSYFSSSISYNSEKSLTVTLFSSKPFAQSFNSNSALSQKLKEGCLGGVNHNAI